jgi:glycosyltransferase involved in cell wall biosynthesis
MAAPKTGPVVSVVIPARNEEANIGECVRSLLGQGSGTRFGERGMEIIVADDGSEDRTAAIVRDLAAGNLSMNPAGNPGVKLVPVPTPPDGWLGKTHALHAAVEHARGEWLLFTDADTRHEPGQLAGVIERAEREELDWISLSPVQETRTWWENAVIPVVYQQLAKLYPYERVNNPGDPLAAANGQYILVRRRVYDALGGHAAVRNSLLEDVALARTGKQAGVPMRFESGEGTVRTRMYRRFPEMWQGWTKNLFLLYDQDYGAICRASGELACRYLLPAAGGTALLLGSGWTAAAGAGLLVYLVREHWRYWRGLPAEDRNARTALLLPGVLLFLLVLWNSTLCYSGQEKIAWKGRRYRATA